MPGKELKGRSKRAMYSNGELVGGQKTIAKAAPPPDKITGDDFKALRVKKSMGGGLYENIHKKKARIAAGSGEKMRKVGAKGAPTSKNFKDAAKTAKKA